MKGNGVKNKLLGALLFAAAALTTTACDSDDDDGEAADPIVGRWAATGVTADFATDGTGEMEIVVDVELATVTGVYDLAWTVKDTGYEIDLICVEVEDALLDCDDLDAITDPTLDCELDGDTLTCEDDLELTRAG